ARARARAPPWRLRRRVFLRRSVAPSRKLGSARAPAPALQIRKRTCTGLPGRGGGSGPGNNLSSVTGNWRGSSFAVERYVRRAAATPTLSGPAEPRAAGPGLLGVALAAEALRVGGNRRLLPPPPPRPPLEAPESLRGCPESPATVEGPKRRAAVVGLAGGEDTAAPSRVARNATLRTLLNAGGVCARSPIRKDPGRPRACVSQRSELASLNGEADRSGAPASLEARSLCRAADKFLTDIAYAKKCIRHTRLKKN
ncbi:uncharacterized protein LOC112630149, partial [Theropithecus gelada]|uniref:uncharacterized protein LOC112630149 n=1 Tax=Theropithecus gelada TaxID=9565 RepID=UPI000DC16397